MAWNDGRGGGEGGGGVAVPDRVAAALRRLGASMSRWELLQLADLLEKLIRRESLTESERWAAIKLVAEADRLAEKRGIGERG